MPAFTVAGTVELTGVGFTGSGEGTVGSTLTWTGLNAGGGNADQTLNSGADNNLDVGADTLSGPEAGLTFTGYTINSGGVDYPVFSNGANYVVALNENGIGQSTIAGSGASNVYSDPDTGFLCFAAGTAIATASGDVAVETLSIGDEVLTAEGKAVKVKWVGRQTVSTRFAIAERLMMVRIAAGALGAGVPAADLTVTADHAMLVDGVLCHAGALINGTSITQVPTAELGETYTVYHVETDAHDIILANGAPAETFIDNVSRQVFDNYAEFEALYGDVAEMDELPLPRAMSARQLPAVIRKRLGLEQAA